jgi:hypothetical protein
MKYLHRLVIFLAVALAIISFAYFSFKFLGTTPQAVEEDGTTAVCELMLT